MALKIGDKVVFSGNSPFSHSTAVHTIVDIKTINKDDKIKVSMGVRRLLEKKGSIQVCLTDSAKKNNESYLPVRFYKKLQEVKSGSFMLVEDVKLFQKESEIYPIIYAQHFVAINGEVYIPTERVQKHLSEQEWRTMQSKVTTLILGLK